MSFAEKSTPKVILTTTGRITGKPHSVPLRAVVYNRKLYFSRHRPDGDWLKNALQNNSVQVQFEEHIFDGMAVLVNNEELAAKISQLKYPGEERAKEKRVVLEVAIKELMG